MLFRFPGLKKIITSPSQDASQLPASTTPEEECDLFRTLWSKNIKMVWVPELAESQCLYPELSLIQWAVYSGNLANIAFIKDKAPSLFVESVSLPWVLLAILSNQLPMAEWLVAQGLGSWQDKYCGMSTAFMAVYAGHEVLARTLVEQHRASWHEDSGLYNVLHVALLAKNYGLASWLINEQNFPLDTSFTVSSLVKISNEANARLCEEERTGTIFDCLKTPAMSFINQYLPQLEQGSSCTFPLMIVMVSAHEEATLHWLVDQGFGAWSDKDSFGIDIVTYLLMFKAFDTLEKLLAAKHLDFNVFKEEDLFPTLIVWHNFEAVQWLLNHEVLNKEELSHASIMNSACQFHDMRAITWLVEQGFSSWDQVYTEDAGFQLFHYAIEAGFMELIELLIANNYNTWLDETRPDNEQGGGPRNALQIAIDHGQTEIVQILLRQGHFEWAENNEEGSLLERAIGSGNLEMTQWLIDNNYAEWSVTFYRGATILHKAIDLHWKFGDLKQLAEVSGSNWQARDADGKTVLHYAVEKLNFIYLQNIQAESKLNWLMKDNNQVNLLQKACGLNPSSSEESHEKSRLALDDFCFQIAKNCPQLLNARSLEQPQEILPISQISAMRMIINKERSQLLALFLDLQLESNIPIEEDVFNETLKNKEATCLNSVLDKGYANSLSVETLLQLIETTSELEIKAVLHAEVMFKRERRSSIATHHLAEQWMFDQSDANPNKNYDALMQRFLAENLTAQLHKPFELRVLPSLRECLENVLVESAPDIVTHVPINVIDVIHGYATTGCPLSIQPSVGPVIFSFKRKGIVESIRQQLEATLITSTSAQKIFGL